MVTCVTYALVSCASSCCIPGRVPRSPSKTSWYSLISWSAVFALVVSLLCGILMLATCPKFSGCISRSPMCWLAFAPSSGVNSSLTTANSTEYFLLFFGFRILTQVIPSGFNSDLFHICTGCAPLRGLVARQSVALLWVLLQLLRRSFCFRINRSATMLCSLLNALFNR